MTLPGWRDKVVIVTGSSRGIGRETARKAWEAGCRVVLHGRDAEALEATRSKLASSDRLLTVVADLANPDEARRLVATVLQTWGRIDVLVNNVGQSMRGSFAELSDQTVRTMVDANLLSAVWTTRAALGALRESQGTVVFVSSLAGLRGFPGVSLYSASKMALTALHQSLRAEEGPRGVAACLVYLAFTENDPDKTVLAADGRRFRHDRKWTMTQTQAAQAILTAVAQRRPRLVLTAGGWWLDRAQAWIPALVDRIVWASGGRIHRVEEKRP